jgi:hypothetical protein
MKSLKNIIKKTCKGKKQAKKKIEKKFDKKNPRMMKFEKKLKMNPKNK